MIHPALRIWRLQQRDSLDGTIGLSMAIREGALWFFCVLSETDTGVQWERSSAQRGATDDGESRTLGSGTRRSAALTRAIAHQRSECLQQRELSERGEPFQRWQRVEHWQRGEYPEHRQRRKHP